MGDCTERQLLAQASRQLRAPKESGKPVGLSVHSPIRQLQLTQPSQPASQQASAQASLQLQPQAMRVASLFTASICALFAVASATQEAQQASVHIRVGAVDHDNEQGPVAAAAVVPAVASEDAMLKTKSKSHHHHLRELNKCRSLVKESFRYDIVTTCAVRGVGFNFYYQLKDGRIMRNCMCESFNNGVLNVDLGKVMVSKFNLQCYSKDAKTTNAALKNTFDHRSITCASWDFEEL